MTEAGTGPRADGPDQLPRSGAAHRREDAPTSLTDATRTGVKWAALSRIAVQVIQFGSTIVLARLLTPDAYGLVSIVLVLSAFTWLFTDLGLGAAIIHRQELDERTLSAAFWLNALTGLALTAVFAALAVPISRFYDRPALVGLIITGSLGFTLSMSTVHLALLERSMRFKTIARVEILAVTLSVGVGITSAAAGLGPYSLIFASLTQTVATTILMWLAARWMPRRFLDGRAVREIWTFSSHLFGFNVVNFWARNLDNVLVGKVSGAAALGLYARAYNLMMLPVQQVTAVLGRVLFPSLARLQHDPERLRRGYLRALVTMATVATPIAVFFVIAAKPFILVVYGPRWAEVAPLLAILAASSPAQIIAGSFGALFQALARTRTQFRYGLVNTALTVVAIVLGLHWGPKGVAIALLIKFWVAMPVVAHGCWPAAGLRYADVGKAIWPTWAAATVMTVAMLGVRAVFPANYTHVLLLLEGGTGVIAYVAFLRVISPVHFREIKTSLLARTHS